MECRGVVLFIGLVFLSTWATCFAADIKNNTKSVTVSTLLSPPFVMRDENTGEYSGFFVDILTALNFKIEEFDTIIADEYGMEDSPGQWTGVIGHLTSGKADIAVAPFSIRSKLTKAVTFTQPIIHAGYMVLYKIPPREEQTAQSAGMMTLLYPFSAGLWTLIVVMCLATSVALCVIRRFSPYEDPAGLGTGADNSMGSTCSNSLLFTFGSFMGQSYSAAPKSTSGRILSTFWWMFALMTVAAYVSGLVVVLFKTSSHVSSLPFSTVTEMIKQKNVDILCVKDSATYNYMANHKGVYEQKVYKMWKANWDRLMVDSMETALKMMDEGDGKYAIFMDEAMADYLASSTPCNKMVIGEPVGDRRFGLACRKGSTLCEDLNQGILDLQERGQMEKLRHKWFWSGCHMSSEMFYGTQASTKTSKDEGEGSFSPLSLTTKRFTVAFVLMVIGLVLSIGFLVIEIVCGRRKGNIRLKNLDGNDDVLRINDTSFTPDGNAL